MLNINFTNYQAKNTVQQAWILSSGRTLLEQIIFCQSTFSILWGRALRGLARLGEAWRNWPDFLGFGGVWPDSEEQAKFCCRMAKQQHAAVQATAGSGVICFLCLPTAQYPPHVRQVKIYS